MKYIIIASVLFLFLGCSNEPIDGAALYKQKCANCHGKFARKSALGKSQVIANWSKEKIKNAVIGYQEKTYGRSMKGLMRSEVKSLNEEQVDALANYISNLNH